MFIVRLRIGLKKKGEYITYDFSAAVISCVLLHDLSVAAEEVLFVVVVFSVQCAVSIGRIFVRQFQSPPSQ